MVSIKGDRGFANTSDVAGFFCQQQDDMPRAISTLIDEPVLAQRLFITGVQGFHRLANPL